MRGASPSDHHDAGCTCERGSFARNGLIGVLAPVGTAPLGTDDGAGREAAAGGGALTTEAGFVGAGAANAPLCRAPCEAPDAGATDAAEPTAPDGRGAMIGRAAGPALDALPGIIGRGGKSTGRPDAAGALTCT